MLKFVCKSSSSINGFRPLRHVFSATSYSSFSTIHHHQQQQQQQELPSSFLPNFFVENLGFSEKQSLSFSAKIAAGWRADAEHTRVSALTFASTANSVINFFKSLGFHDSRIRNFVSCDPRVLTYYRIDKTQIPGCSGFGYFWFRLFLSNSSSQSYLLSNARLLEKDYGISTDIFRHQGAYLRNPELFKKTLMEVEHKWGISPSSGMFLYGVHIFGSLSAELIESKIRLFKSFGWNQSHVMTIINKHPHCLGISEAKLRKSLDFFMNEMGYEPAYLACHPFLFTYSLETRILPRQRILVVLKEKGLIATDCSLFNVSKLTESKFFHMFVQPFKDDIPDLYQEYIGIRGRHTNETEIGAA